ncbi:MAG: hypothetical protein ABIJ43_05935 [Candidatus Beckwithbacteria bacterium]
MTEVERNLAIFEDHQRSIDSMQRLLEMSGYSVVGLATTMQEAQALIDQLKDLGVKVALVDGNLVEGDYSNYDGQQIIEQIQEKAPGVRTIGQPSRGSIPGANFNVSKGESPRSLINALEAIFSSK